MSFFEKKAYLSSYFDKKESISDRESPRRLKVALKHLRADEKVHNDGKPSDRTANNQTESASVSATDDTHPAQDGLMLKSEEDNDDSFCFDTEIFRVYCKCAECLQYREVLIQLVLEDREYNTLWDRLKALIREFYDIIPQNPAPYDDSMDAKYENLISRQARWFTDGHIDKQKNIQLSLSSHLPLSNEMTFILVFSMLYTRDPHQLFELLCIQLRCISLAYCDGLKNLIKTNEENQNPEYNPVELLTFILDGYDKFCSTAKKLSSLLFELQRDHLQQFSLTWTLLNKRMYQRYVYMEIQELIPECILKLKELLEAEEYEAMAHRLIRFDEDMTSIAKSWSEVWSLMQNYHVSSEEMERRNRIRCIEELLKAIRDCEFDFTGYEKLLKRDNASKWMKMENRDEAWILTVDYLKRCWDEKDDSRLFAFVCNDRCVTCDFALASHYADCDCVTCVFAGGACTNQTKDSAEKPSCMKCSFYEKLDRDYIDYIRKDITRHGSEKSLANLVMIDDENNQNDLDASANDTMLANHCYHLSWAVFKHLSSRKKYNSKTFNSRHFCSFQDPPCTKNECRVATHIIAGLYPLNFSKFLIKAYQPLKEEERKELMNIQKLYFSYLMQKISDDKTQKVDMLNQMELLWNIDGAEYTLFCDIGSAFAECYLIEMQIPVHDLLDSCFIVDNQDIELNMYWLECIYMFKESENSPLKKIENNPKVLEFQSRMQMNQISGMNDTGKLSLTSSKSPTAEKSSKSSDNDCAGKSQNKIKPESYERLRALLDAMKIETKSESNDADEEDDDDEIDDDEDDEEIDEEIVNECKRMVGAKAKISLTASKSIDNISPSPCRETKCKKHEACDKDNLTEKDVTLADAVKIAVKQQLNQKLEAELKSLKKEHSVLKDMVRDLEQIKENEENQLITKKEKNVSANNGSHHCCSEHSDMLENHANHTKMCHRGDGQCTCYYCTIFGHAECNHGRTNETRDRLRKRLHQIHSKSSTKTHNVKNIKSQPGVLKKMLATKVTTPNNSINSTNTANASNVKQATKPVVEQKDNSANEMLEAALQENWTKLGGSNGKKSVSAKTINGSIANDPNDPKCAVKKRKLLNAVKLDNQSLYDCESSTCNSCDSKLVKSKTATSTTGSSLSEAKAAHVRPKFCELLTEESASLDDILDFIEGNTTNKKDSQKKAAKKAKQKQKKEDVKRIEELEQLRDQFHDAFYKESDTKNELKNLKSVKKRDKKKIAEFETSIKKYGKFKSKIESNILELISTLKKNNPDFKFAYLPTKEQQLEKQLQQELAQAKHAQAKQPATIMAEQVKAQQEKSNNVRIIQSDQIQESQPRCEISLDQSKRMVTIRRINLPHAEPQVTVTAKGSSPDKDKLLYTFINGQLIPGSNVPSTINSPATPVAPPINPIRYSSEKIDKKVKQPQNMQLLTDIALSTKTSNKKTVEAIEKAAKKIKEKEKIAEKKATNEKSNSRKQSPEAVKPSANNNETTNKKSSTANNGKAAKNASNTAVKEAKEGKAKEKKKSKRDVENEVDSITSSVRDITIDAEKPKKEKKKPKAVKFEYADPNYKVNQFGLLDMDEDDDYYIESSSDESCEPEPPRIVKAPTITKPPTPPIQTVTANEPQSQQSKNTKTKPTKSSKAAEPAKKVTADANAKVSTVKTDKKPIASEVSQVNATKSQSNPTITNANSAAPPQTKPVDNNLSKKQKKKQKQQQTLQTNTAAPKASTDKINGKAESSVNSINSSMQRLQLNSDATNEASNSHQTTANKPSLNVSIMDQLNRGVKVEGLMLPPGITLTRVDPNTAEGLRAKKESITRISQPAPTQYQQPVEYQRPPPFLAGAAPGVVPMQSSNGFIMVDPMQNMSTASSIIATVSDSGANTKKNRKNRKKNKNKAEEENAPSNKPKIVTLRNPLFQGTNDLSRVQQPMPLQQRNQIPLNINQPASIIKNDNGMFTIRNTALHQALSNGVSQAYRPYAAEMYETQEAKPEIYSYFSENVNNAPTSSASTVQPEILRSPIAIPKVTPASHMAIGSEIKNAQMKNNDNADWMPGQKSYLGNRSESNKYPDAWYSSQGQQKYGGMNGDIFSTINHLNPKRSYSPFDMGTNFGFNSDFIGSAQNGAAVQPPTNSTIEQTANRGAHWPIPMRTEHTRSIPLARHTDGPHPNESTLDDTNDGMSTVPRGCNQFFNMNGGYPFNNQAPTDSDSLFGSNRSSKSLANSTHCCDESPNPQDHFGTKATDENSFFKKFDDDSFLHGLHPGQRLNSEVTIHNINDSKFNRDAVTPNLRDGIEITRINGPDSFTANPNLAVGSQRTSTHDDLNHSATSEFGDSVFVPNSAVNLSELERTEREIETFKRFNYYFEPPKNKPKINFNVKDIVVTKKQPTSDNSSPYFGELAASSLSNTPHPEDDIYNDVNAFKSNNCDPLKPHPTTNHIHLDNFLHGIIGDEPNTDH